jgi:hypothetical protein
MPIPSVPTSHYLAHRNRTLRTICRELGRDADGRACAACELRTLCELIERRCAAPPADSDEPAASSA